ncbi:hypothetical protein ACEQPO_31005 [Bacillus sp. SL00103]
MTIDELSKKWDIPLNQSKFHGQFGTGFVSGQKGSTCKAAYIYELIR